MTQFLAMLSHVWHDSRVPILARIVVVLATLYWINPFDLVPDFQPGGYCDDVTIFCLLLVMALRLVPEAVFRDSHQAALLGKKAAFFGMLYVTAGNVSCQAQAQSLSPELFYKQGKDKEAEPLCIQALQMREKALGPDHPNVAASLNSLAALYDAQGKYAEAEPLYKRSLQIRENTLSADHRDVGGSLNNLAMLYCKQGKYEEAEPLCKRSLQITEKALGPDHPDVARSLNNLAAVYDAQGQYAEAEELYNRSLQISKMALSPDHPDVAAILNNLAELHKAQGQHADTEKLEDAKKIFAPEI